jgi:flagellar biosynthesis protein FlhB
MQPYPSGAKVPAPAGPDLPPPVKMAVRLMWIGAALSAISAVVAAVTVSSLRDAIVKVHPAYTTTQIHNAERAQAFLYIFIGVISVGFWIWMSFANRSGKQWTRIVATVLFGINTVYTALTLAATAIGLVFVLLLWLDGLAATILLWRREAGRFYKREQAA